MEECTYIQNLEQKYIEIVEELFKLQLVNLRAIKCIEDFIISEDYINLNGQAIAENYLKITKILRAGINNERNN